MAVKSWKIVLLFGLPWSMFMTIFGTLLQGALSYPVILYSFVAGAFAGWVFSFLIRYATSGFYDSIVVEVVGDEKHIIQGRANRLVDGQKVGGKLVLTQKQLIFKSHMMNTQTHQYVIYLDQIEHIKVTRAFGVLVNGLCVVLRNKETLRFDVSNAKSWTRLIEMQRFGTTVRMRTSTVADGASISPLTN